MQEKSRQEGWVLVYLVVEQGQRSGIAAGVPAEEALPGAAPLIDLHACRQR